MRYALTSSEQGLILVDRYGQKPPLRIDYTSKSFNQRRRHLTPKHEQLIKAVNQKPGATVLDMTPGLGFDAFILASYGHQVVMIERSKVVYLLVKDALKRAALVEELIPTVSRMQLLLGDSTQQAWQEQKFDVAVIDPMFDAKKKSALPIGSMQMLQAFLGSGAELQPFFDAARARGIPRTLIKRPRVAQYQLAGGQRPVYQLMGRSHRWDVFFNQVS